MRILVPALLTLTLLTPGLSAAVPPAVGAVPGDSSPPPTIAIIIDDMGHDLTQGMRLVKAGSPITLAFLPYRPYTTQLAEAAHQHRKEVMLHVPMANTHNIGLGQGGLDVSMDQATTTTTLRRDLSAIPYVKGVNNHMGSELTQMQPNMDWVMSELFRYPVYFVDSRTIASTVAGKTASRYNVPNLDRDVFLDNEQTEAYIDRQFQELIRKARENGTAIGIGHPHKATVDYLLKKLPELDEQGIAVATVSALWAMRNHNHRMFADGEKQPITKVFAKQN